MNTHPDFEELLRLLEEHAVDYMIVGDYGVAWHGYPRFTKYFDIIRQVYFTAIRISRERKHPCLKRKPGVSPQWRMSRCMN